MLQFCNIIIFIILSVVNTREGTCICKVGTILLTRIVVFGLKCFHTILE